MIMMARGLALLVFSTLIGCADHADHTADESTQSSLTAADLSQEHADDRALGLAYHRFWVHPVVPNTILYIDDYAGALRFTASSDDAKRYVAGLAKNKAYQCSFKGRSAECADFLGGGVLGCNVLPGRQRFDAVTCQAQ